MSQPDREKNATADDAPALAPLIGKGISNKAMASQPGESPAKNASTIQAAGLLEANEQLVLASLRAQLAEEALREAARHKDEFLAMLGHELRNPLVPIRNAAAVLQHLAGSDKKLTWVHDVLVRQVGHMTRLVDDLLDVSLVARGKMQLRLEPVDVGSAIRQALEATEELIQQKRHRLKLLLPKDLIWVHGDSLRLTQVFQNLLTNAVKYTDDEGLISVSLEAAGSTALIRVGDSGIGISPDIKPRIFELFVQDARSVDRSEGGLGVGLALVRHLVEMHKGTVEVHSEGAGKGSEFFVRLPLSAQANRPQHDFELHSGGGTGRVMVVDDDADACESTAFLLKLHGYEVESAFNLASAMKVGGAFRPQVVLMDIALPGADGYEVKRRLSEMPEIDKETIYIGVTGFGQPDDFRRSEAAGFAHHLVKPVDPEDLFALLNQFLKARRKGDRAHPLRSERDTKQ